MLARCQWRTGHPPYRDTSRFNCMIEVVHVPEEVGIKCTPDPSGCTARVYLKGDLTKSDYLTFDSGGLCTIIWRALN